MAGLIAIGLRTAKERGQDIISKARPIPLDGVIVAKHSAVVRDWIYPRPTGVRFDLAVTQRDPDHGLLVIEILAQPEALKPFFVRRARRTPANRASRAPRPPRCRHLPIGTSPSFTP